MHKLGKAVRHQVQPGWGFSGCSGDSFNSDSSLADSSGHEHYLDSNTEVSAHEPKSQGVDQHVP
jgi:hypothetical protein